MDYKIIRSKMNYEIVAKLFFDLAEERYLSTDKIKQSAASITDKISRQPYESLHLKIALLSVIRNMVREVSPTQLYRAIQHRDELYSAVIQTLEELEDSLEELREQMGME